LNAKVELQAPKQELHMSQTVRLATGLAPPVDRIRTPASACAVAARTVAAAAGTAAAGTVATGFRPLTVLECNLNLGKAESITMGGGVVCAVAVADTDFSP
jgi:hypothetical protein